MLLLFAILNSLLYSVGSLWGCSSCTNPKTLIASSYNSDIKVWDPNTGTPCFLLLTGHSGQVTKALFSPDMSKLYSVAWDFKLKAWDLTTGQCILTQSNIHSTYINALVFHPSASSILTASSDGTIKIWRTTDFTLLRTITKTGVSINRLEISPDGNKIGVFCIDSTTQVQFFEVFDYNTGASLKYLGPDLAQYNFLNHLGFVDNNYIYCFAFSSIQDTLKIRIYDMANNYALYNTITVGSGAGAPYYAPPFALRATQRNELIIHWGNKIEFWDVNTWQPLSSRIQVMASYNINYYLEIKVSFDEKYLLIADDTTLNVWDYDTRTLLKAIVTESTSITMNAIGSQCFCSNNLCCECNLGLTPISISSQCLSNYFASITQCSCGCVSLCTSPCQTCSPWKTSCLSCISNYYLSGTSCVTTCPAGTYPDSNVWKCKSCHYSCLSCTVLTFFDANTNTCYTTCPSGKFGQTTDSTCQPCIPPCQNCAGTGSSCTSCVTNTYLSGTICINTCPESYYPDSSDWKCKPCNALCIRCTGPNSNNCLSCSGSNVLVGTTCSAICPSGKFLQTNNNTCAACMSSCMTCSRKDSCLTCSQGFYLFDSSILMDCIACNISGYSIKESYCIKCPPQCKSCSDVKFCERCLEGYYLQFSGINNQSTGVCKSCDSPGEYIDSKFGLPYGLGFCLNHSECQIEKCQMCSNLYRGCQICKDGLFTHYNSDKGVDYCSQCERQFYLKQDLLSGNKTCLPKVKVSVNLSNTNNHYVYRLLFNETLEEYFRDYLRNFNLEIKGKSKEYYSCNITQDERMKYLFFILCKFNWNVTKDESLILKLINIPEDSETSSYEIRDREFSVFIETLISCSVGYSYNRELATCEPPPNVTINMELRNTKDPLKYHLILNKPITEDLDSLIKNSLRGKISNSSALDEVPINFTVKKLDNYVFEISFNFSQIIINRPVFSLEVKSYATYVKFSNTELSIPLSDYYFVSPEATKTFQQAGATSQSGAKTSENLMPLSPFILPGSMFLLKGMVLLQTFQLLKFINIDYPPNVRPLFDDKISSFMLDFDIQADSVDGILDDSFYKYNFSIYFLNNAGSYIIAGCLFLLLGVIGTYLFPALRKRFGDSLIFLRVIDFLEETLVWNYFLNHILSRYMILIFTGVAAFRFRSLNSGIGKINFVCALLSNFLLFAIPVLIFVKLNQIAKLRTRKIIPVKVNSRLFAKEMPLSSKKSLKFDVPSPKNRTLFEPIQKKLDFRFVEVLDTKSSELPKTIIERKDFPVLSDTMPKGKHNNEINTDILNTRESSTREIEISKNKSDDFQKDLSSQNAPFKNNNKDGEFKTSETNTLNNEEIDKLSVKFKPIHEDFRNDNRISHYFILFELVRQIITAFLILFGDGSPVMVSLLIILINGLFIIFLIWVKPYKTFQKFILTIIIEFFLFIICLGVLGIGFLQSYMVETKRNLKPEDLDVLIRIGWFVVIANIMLVYIFLTIQIIFFLFEIVRLLKIVSPKFIGRLNQWRSKRL